MLESFSKELTLRQSSSTRKAISPEGELCVVMGEHFEEESDRFKVKMTTPEGEVKMVPKINFILPVQLRAKQRLLTVNKTSLKKIVEAWGLDDSNWVGKKLKLTPEVALVGGQKRQMILAVPVPDDYRIIKSKEPKEETSKEESEK